jgi:hypothetical protein
MEKKSAETDVETKAGAAERQRRRRYSAEEKARLLAEAKGAWQQRFVGGAEVRHRAERDVPMAAAA